MKELSLKVPDISCGHCVAAVRDALETMEGVQEVHVSLEARTVLVRGTDELAPSEIAEAIREAGYTPQVGD